MLSFRNLSEISRQAVVQQGRRRETPPSQPVGELNRKPPPVGRTWSARTCVRPLVAPGLMGA
ncbi:hypothetical protein ACFQ1S_21660, partial [Kibdelosporangium lantanae]